VFFILIELKSFIYFPPKRRYNYEEYIHEEIRYLEKKDEDEDLYLEVGEHEFPFRIKLADVLPTSVL
jgi:hypothetical protein